MTGLWNVRCDEEQTFQILVKRADRSEEFLFSLCVAFCFFIQYGERA